MLQSTPIQNPTNAIDLRPIDPPWSTPIQDPWPTLDLREPWPMQDQSPPRNPPISTKKSTYHTHIRANLSKQNVKATLEQNIEMRLGLGITGWWWPDGEQREREKSLRESKGKGRNLKKRERHGRQSVESGRVRRNKIYIYIYVYFLQLSYCAILHVELHYSTIPKFFTIVAI